MSICAGGGARPVRRHTSTRGPAWFLLTLAYLAVLGGVRALLDDGLSLALFAVVSLAATCSLWWFTAWFMLLGQVRWRVLLPSGLVTGLAMSGYAVSANVWMSDVVTRNQDQFGYFGISLALVTWFSGAAICILVGACAGAVLAADTGKVGALIRGPVPSLLVERAARSLPAPEDAPRLSDAFRQTEDDAAP